MCASVRRRGLAGRPRRRILRLSWRRDDHAQCARSSTGCCAGYDRLYGLEFLELSEQRGARPGAGARRAQAADGARPRRRVRVARRVDHLAGHGAGGHRRRATWPRACPTCTNFLRPITDGAVHALATRLHRGRTTWVWDVRMSDDADRTCAVTRMTIAVRPLPRPPSSPALTEAPRRAHRGALRMRACSVRQRSGAQRRGHLRRQRRRRRSRVSGSRAGSGRLRCADRVDRHDRLRGGGGQARGSRRRCRPPPPRWESRSSCRPGPPRPRRP